MLLHLQTRNIVSPSHSITTHSSSMPLPMHTGPPQLHPSIKPSTVHLILVWWAKWHQTNDAVLSCFPKSWHHHPPIIYAFTNVCWTSPATPLHQIKCGPSHMSVVHQAAQNKWHSTISCLLLMPSTSLVEQWFQVHEGKWNVGMYDEGNYVLLNLFLLCSTYTNDKRNWEESNCDKPSISWLQLPILTNAHKPYFGYTINNSRISADPLYSCIQLQAR